MKSKKDKEWNPGYGMDLESDRFCQYAKGNGFNDPEIGDTESRYQ